VVLFLAGKRFISSPKCLDRFWGPSMVPIQWGIRGSFPKGTAAMV